MGRSAAGLQKKKVTVHGRKGTYQRSVMVRGAGAKAVKRSAGAPTKDRSGVRLAAKVGFITGALGAHRTEFGGVAGHLVAHGLAEGHRQKTGNSAKSGAGHVWNVVKTHVASEAGQWAGEIAHEGVRRGIARFSHTKQSG